MSDWPDFSKDPKGWKRGFDATMRGIFEGIAETSRKMDEVEKMRHEQEAAWGWRPRPLVAGASAAVLGLRPA
jgi:hypothetical protein